MPETNTKKSESMYHVIILKIRILSNSVFQADPQASIAYENRLSCRHFSLPSGKKGLNLIISSDLFRYVQYSMFPTYS